MKHSVRNWHTWGSLALGIPLLLVGLTTFFIAHEKSLGTKEIILPMNAVHDENIEIRASLQVGDELWFSTLKQGVFRLQGEQAIAIAGSPKDEIRAMIQHGDALFLAGKKALWRLKDGESQAVHRADCWGIQSHAQGLIASCKNVGLLRSPDGKEWQAQPMQFSNIEAMTVNTGGTTLSKIIMDIHTGKLFFGKQYEWIWIDLLGLACVGLGLTGLLMWMRSRKLKAASHELS